MQSPQSKVSRAPPGSNRLVLPDAAMSKMLLRPNAWGKIGVSRADCDMGAGEKLEWASLESAEETAEGDDAYETGGKDVWLKALSASTVTLVRFFDGDWERSP